MKKVHYAGEKKLGRKYTLGERIFGAGMITGYNVRKNRNEKVYGRVFGVRK